MFAGYRSPPLAGPALPRGQPVWTTDLASPVDGCSCQVEAEAGPAGQILVVRLIGDIDALTHPTVKAALAAALDQVPGNLVVDLAGVRFCGVCGFVLLAEVARTARASGIGYAVSGSNSFFDRIAAIVGADEETVRYRSLADAVSAIRMDHT